MVLSTDWPLTTAHRLAPPLPKWQLTAQNRSSGMCISRAVSVTTYWWLMPWYPYLRIPMSRLSAWGMA